MGGLMLPDLDQSFLHEMAIIDATQFCETKD